MTEVRERASVHIATEEAIRQKRAHERHGEAKYKERPREAQPRATETNIARRTDKRYVPYVVQKVEERKGVPRLPIPPALPVFTVPLKRLLDDSAISSRLEQPRKTDRILGYNWSAWCVFHQTRGHDTERCQALIFQLAGIVEIGHLKQYIQTKEKEVSSRGTTPKDNDHVTPILGDFNTIAGGFSGGGTSAASRKRYSWGELICKISELKPVPESIIYFSSADKADVSPHENDPVVITVIIMG